MLQLSFIAIAFLSTVSALAHEPKRGKIMATVGPYIYQTQTTKEMNDAKSPVLGGFALLAEGGVDKNGGVELGMIYLHKLYLRNSNGNVVSQKMKRMHMTVGYRHWFNTYFSTALSYYTSYSMGDAHTNYNDFPGGNAVYTSAQRTAENGFDLSLQYEVHRQKEYTIAADVRYSWSITDRRGENADVLGVIIGFKKEIKER